ncbi:ABC transporter permease [Colwellia psychrerythraea]|uniref:Putative membrane protein n=1 Tax=Colwellia psychrerythraea (strain 34H / ATCC BAA-681) TaxID=167879 RepID=Q484E3_COLP3|nr:ABC transporter permease [Colwellia psychrerythraea]AAZ24862.1 putative membrane protein [Colwellia psychrerythraea 34H]
MTWKRLISCEFYAIFTNIPLLVTVFGGVIIYSFLYPLPYINQTPQEQSIAVINLDDSQLSRTIERMANATPQVNITQQVYSIEEAKALLIEGHITGFLLIPQHFYRDLLLEKSPHLLFAGNASYFLVYGTVIEGLVRSTSTLAAEVKVSRMVMRGDNIALASSQYSAIGLNLKPTFNASLGYLNYIVPAVFVLILHQTLLIALGLLTAGQYENKVKSQPISKLQSSYWLIYPVWRVLLVRSLLMLTIYLVLFSFYFGYSFESYGINRLATIPDLMTLAFPFLLSVIFLGTVVGLLIPRKELATLVVLLSSLPLVFSAGFIWPTSNMPTVINIITQFFPSTPAINGFLRLNQMGDSIDNLVQIQMQLWSLTLLYAMIAGVLMTKKQGELNRMIKSS